MCCKCCSVTQQKVWVFGIGTLLLVGGILSVAFWPTFIESVIYKKLPLSPDSITFDKWQETPIPVYTQMYLFNWTNAGNSYPSYEKPKFERVGPYVYREVLSKENIVWHANKTVTYQPKRMWYFEPEMSGGKLDDLITCPHLPSIAASNVVRNEPRALKLFFNIALNRNGGALYQTHTAAEWIFDGFYDEFLAYAMTLKNNSMAGNIESEYFALFLNRNGSTQAEGTFTIHTGENDLTQMGEIQFWNGVNNTGYYEGDCGRLNGSASDLYPPKRNFIDYITVYITDTCRIINLAPVDHVKVRGIEGIRYQTRADTFDNGQRNADMKCYCPIERQPDNCPATGATDLSPCAEGAPMYLSHINFHDADPSYADTIESDFSIDESDIFFIVIEPKMAVPLQVNAAVQINLHIQPDKDITILRNIPEFYAPLFVLKSQAVIDKELSKTLKFALNLPSLGRNIGIGLLCLGGILIIIGVVLTITGNWYRQNEMSKNDNTEKGDKI